VPADVVLLGSADVRQLAARLGVRPTRILGQNFMHDPNTVRRIARLSEVGPKDVVLEIGPGLGSLTLALLETGAQVIAVEVDATLAGALGETVAHRAPGAVHRLSVLPVDALRLTAAELVGAVGEPDTALPGSAVSGSASSAWQPPARLPSALVANLPYNIAVPVLLTLLERLPSLVRGLVLVQAEVAERLAAGPAEPAYGVPSVKVSWYAQVSRAGGVSRSVFWPVPNVDSGLVAFYRHDPPAPTACREDVFTCVDAAFAQRRKTLRAALAGWAGSAVAAERILRVAGVDPRSRGEQLSVRQFADVVRAQAAVRDGPAGR
jgi:16S rRNA (adenine1518-N6/adenine1519-N6)-dimethyltransferase